MEIVHIRDGRAVALDSCPAWCTAGRHFQADATIDADDGYHHCGPETIVPASNRYLGLIDELETVVRMKLTAWTRPVHAEPGPTLIELDLETVEAGSDVRAELAPAQARTVAHALLDLATTAENTAKNTAKNAVGNAAEPAGAGAAAAAVSRCRSSSS